MANRKTSLKDIKQTRKRSLLNLRKKRALKATIKKYLKAVQAKSDEAPVLLQEAFSKLDKAAKTNLIHKNTADRKKSQLAKKLAISK